MAHYEYADQEGNTATMPREEFVGVFLKSTGEDRPLSNAELADLANDYRSAAYGKLPDGTPYKVVPDAEDIREARERYAAETGTAYDSLSGSAREAAAKRISRYANNMADDSNTEDVTTIRGRLSDALKRHRAEWADWDSEHNGGTYGELLSELQAENNALSNREKLRAEIESIPDEKRRAEWMAKVPGIFGEA